MAHASVLVALLNDKTAFKTPNLVGSHSYAAQKKKKTMPWLLVPKLRMLLTERVVT